MTSLNVVEIFDSIDGEGIRTGMPVTFIRLAGCNLQCSYCDTEYAQKTTDGKAMSIDDIVANVNFEAVTITGGEPLLNEIAVKQLIEKLNQTGHKVNIETNGSIDLTPFILTLKAGQGFFTVDYKCPCSNMENKMFLDNFSFMDNTDVLKFVVAGQEDLASVKNFLRNHCNFKSIVYISPCYNTIALPELVENVKELKTQFPKVDIRFQLQLHKYVWPVEMRGV